MKRNILSFSEFLLESVAIPQDVTKSIAEFHKLQSEITRVTAELEFLKDEFKEFDEMVDPVLTGLKETNKKIAITEGYAIKISRFGYERTNKSYAKAFKMALSKVNKSTQKILSEALEASATTSKIKSSYSIDKLSEGEINEAGIWAKIGKAIKGVVGKFLNIFKREIKTIDQSNNELEKLASQLSESIDEKKSEIESINEAMKDISRLESIKKKSGGNPNKAAMYARNMAKSIKDKHKAYARGKAAIEVFGDEGGELARIFFDKAKTLGYDIAKSEYQDLKVIEKPMPRTLKKGKDLTEAKKHDGREGSSWGHGRDGDPILPIGSVNFISGKNKYFNVYETWPDSVLEIWKTRDGKYRAVCTAGKGPIYKIGTSNSFIHDQNSRYLFGGEMVDWVEVEGMMNLVDLYGKSMPTYTYK